MRTEVARRAPGARSMRTTTGISACSICRFAEMKLGADTVVAYSVFCVAGESIQMYVSSLSVMRNGAVSFSEYGLIPRSMTYVCSASMKLMVPRKRIARFDTSVLLLSGIAVFARRFSAGPYVAPHPMQSPIPMDMTTELGTLMAQSIPRYMYVRHMRTKHDTLPVLLI